MKNKNKNTAQPKTQQQQRKKGKNTSPWICVPKPIPSTNLTNLNKSHRSQQILTKHKNLKNKASKNPNHNCNTATHPNFKNPARPNPPTPSTIQNGIHKWQRRSTITAHPPSWPFASST